MIVTPEGIEEAARNFSGTVRMTPVEFSPRLSKVYGARIYFKREDLQEVRSFKIRGAYNKIRCLSVKEKQNGVVTASAGNHAQGVALSCVRLGIRGMIFMPISTPRQKVERVRYFGEDFVDINLSGDDFDETERTALAFAGKTSGSYIPPFDDRDVIAGQGTIGKEIFDFFSGALDYVLAGIGGGGLISGISVYLKEKIPGVRVIGVEPSGAAGMYLSLQKKRIVTLKSLDNFAEGAAVRTVGSIPFSLCQRYVDRVMKVDESMIARTMIDLYQYEGIIAEPAGSLAVSALDDLAREIRGKTVVAVISGGNNDLMRYPEILEKSLAFQGCNQPV